MSREWKGVVDKLYCSLELGRRIVGIKLLKSPDEFEQADAVRLKGAINYCQMVAAAVRGNRIKAKDENFLCRSGARVLGIDPADPKNSRGERWAQLGLYKDEDLSGNIRKELVYSEEKQYGVLVSPIEQMDDFPDVVQIIANPYNCMRIVQGYAYHYGMPKSVNLIGNQAVCLECTGRPYVLKDMNLSLLCIGTRHRAGWNDDEMAVGIPGEQIADVADGLIRTINLMENDQNKAVIEKKLREKNIPLEIRYHYNYYMDC
ncbi:MAG: DUF169 domain-containing protein [Eubacteriales bacterium]|nr:DUF169 domain-containing protein [Eubacteriales bacterium]